MNSDLEESMIIVCPKWSEEDSNHFRSYIPLPIPLKNISSMFPSTNKCSCGEKMVVQSDDKSQPSVKTTIGFAVGS